MWGSQFIADVRNKSAEAMTMVKNDLSEFVCTIQHDTSTAVADTANAVKESLKVEEDEPEGTSARIKQGVSSFFDSLSNSLRENIAHVATAAGAVVSDAPEPVFDRMQARLHEIQTDPATFCSDPDGHLAMYEEWCKAFDPEQHKREISELLVNVPEVRALYARLVPSAVTHVLFWQRYFYKVHQLEQEEKKRAALVARANQAQVEELGWGDDDLSDTEELLMEDVIPVVGVGDEHRSTGSSEGSTTVASVTELAQEGPNKSTVDERKVDGDAVVDVIKEETLTTKEEQKCQVAVEECESLEVKPSQESTEVSAKKIDQSLSTQPSTSNKPVVECPNDSSTQTMKTGADNNATSNREAEAASAHRRDNSSGSVDSSWSKLSEEELKAYSEKGAVSKESGSGSGLSSQSSSSGVLVPGVDDKDVDWADDDLDLNDDDMTEEEVKLIMQNIAASSKEKAQDQGGGDLDDDDWENWD